MGWFGLAGYLLVGAGPALVVFGTLIANRPFLVMLAFISCAMWILVALSNSAVWKPFLPLSSPEYYASTLLVGVVVQEIARPVVWKFHTHGVVKVMDQVARHNGISRLTSGDHFSMSIAWGLGHGCAQSVLFFASTVFLSVGPSSYVVDTCPDVSFFLVAALSSLALLVINTCNMVIAFNSYSEGTALQNFVACAIRVVCGIVCLGNLSMRGCQYVVPFMLTSALVVFAYVVKVTMASAECRITLGT